MADKTIGDYTAASSLDDADLIEVEQGGNSRKATVAQLRQATSISGALVKKAADQTTANYVGGAVVAWDNEGAGCYDTGSFHDNSTNPSRLTTQVGNTYVRVSGQIYATLGTADTFFRAIINKNGSSDYPGVAQTATETGSGGGYIQLSTAIIPVTGGTDYFELFLISESDTSVTIEEERSWFSIEVIA